MILCDQTLNSFQFNLSNSVNAGIESYVAGQGFNIGALSWVLNQWYHVVISRTNGVIKFYRNASEINQYSNNASIGQSTTLTIGKRDYATVHRFLGGIDDLYIWNRGLTPAEIDMLYLGLSLTASNTAPYVGETVQFNSTGSDAIIAWHWDFENDGSYDSDEPNPVHIYTDPGTYSVFLKVDYSTFSDSVLVEDYIGVTYCPPLGAGEPASNDHPASRPGDVGSGVNQSAGHTDHPQRLHCPVQRRSRPERRQLLLSERNARAQLFTLQGRRIQAKHVLCRSGLHQL